MPATESSPTSHKEAVRTLVYCGVLLVLVAGGAFGYRQVLGKEPGAPCEQSFDCKLGVSCVEGLTSKRCRKSCSSDADCPGSQRCKDLSIVAEGERGPQTPLFGTPRACF